MEGTSSVAQHLLQLATNLSLSENNRAAALAYSTAARTPGVSPRVQAYALYQSALHLQRATEVHPEPPTVASDRNRAVAQLRKCSILVRKQPASWNILLQLTALLERIYTSSSDHLGAARAINDGLAMITRHSDRHVVLRWWVYFRGRAIRNALATGNSHTTAAKLAEGSAIECSRSGDGLSAAAFHLTNIQVLLCNRGDLSFDFEKPASCLKNVEQGERQQLDVLMLSAGMHVLHTLSYLRSGKPGTARQHAIDHLLRAYENLRNAHKPNHSGYWHWFTARVLSAITNHCVTMVGRLDRPQRARTASSVALKRIGLLRNGAVSAEDICRACGITQPAARALGVSLLDSAARLHLANLDLPTAAKHIAEAARFAFEDSGDLQILRRCERQETDLRGLLSPNLPLRLLTIRACVMLLFAEYHCLRGMMSGAQAAKRFVSAILSVPHEVWGQIGELWNTDILQSSLSHMSLLTGEERQNGIPGISVEQRSILSRESFNSLQCYGIALFTMGIFYMRKNMVIESLGALNGALRISLDKSSLNEQLAANTLAIRCAPALAHQTVSSSPFQDIEDAMAMAKELDDPVLTTRVIRQKRKLVHRANQPAHVRSQAKRMQEVADSELRRRAQNVGMIL